MDLATILSAILTLTAGIGIFLVACQMMSTNLESVSSNKLKNLFSNAAKSKLLGVGIGALGTAAIQSSGATTVMAIGFVNAGIISLMQAATIIYGANIGTTITAQIVALGMFGAGSALTTAIIFSAFAGIGAFITLFAKKELWKRIGGILTGFGMLFVGLDLMSQSMSDFAALDSVKLFLARINNPVLLVLIGALLTAIIQSSSVMTSIALAMVVTRLINIDQGIFLTMGSNIGSCAVALIAGMTSGRNAKRTALIHLFFNISGVVIFLIVELIIWLASGKTFSYGTMFTRMFPGAPQTQLAMFHTFFNIATVVIILPLTQQLVNMVCRIVPDDDAIDPDAPHLYYLDDNMLTTPPMALQQTKREILNMADLAMQNFNLSLDIICTLDFKESNKFQVREEELNFLNQAIVDFVVKLSEKPQLSQNDHLYLSTTFRSVRDLERIGDYAENIVEYAESLRFLNHKFSKEAIQEIRQVQSRISDLYDKIIVAYTDESLEALEEANVIEDEIDDITKAMEDNHIHRLEAGICGADVGAQYLSLSSNAERVADHLINVGKTIRKFTN